MQAPLRPTTTTTDNAMVRHQGEDDVLMTSPFGDVATAFSKQCGSVASTNMLSSILQGDNCDDWTNMDCDEDAEHLLHHDVHHHQHHHRLVRDDSGMKSRDSTGSIESSSDSSSTVEYEPELSQSFGSAKSYDFMTPIKPPTSLPSTNDSISQLAFAKINQVHRSNTSTSLSSLPNSPHSIISSSNATNQERYLSQQRHHLGEMLGLRLDTQNTSPTDGSNKRIKAPGLAGRLKINLPSPSSSLNVLDVANVPLTPGGHIATGARDGAATGGPPMSPFEPPTPLYAPSEYITAVSPVTPPSSTLRPKLQQRHTSTPLRNNSTSIMGMSPITSQFAAVSMRKASSSKGTTSEAFENSTCTSPTMLLTPPYSPFVTTKPLSMDGDITTSPLERKTSGSSSSSSGSKKVRIGSDVVRSAVSPSSRSKVAKNKVSPYPLPRDESPVKPIAYNTTPTNTDYFQPIPVEAPQQQASMLRDVVKPPMMAPAMEKCVSEPVPKTVSARHLAHRTLHPVFSANYTLGDELGSGGFGFVVSATRDCDGMPVAVKFIFKDKVPSHGWVRDDVFGAIPMEAFVLKVVDSPFIVKFVDLFDDDQFFYLVMEHHGTPWKAPAAEEKKKKAVAAKVAVANAALNKLSLPTSAAMKPTLSTPNAAVTLPSPSVAVFPPESDTPMVPTKLAAAPPRPAPMQRQSSCDLFECIEQHSRLSEDKARWVFAQIVEAVYYLDKRGICHRDIKDENCVIDSDFNVKLIDFGSSVITDPRRPTPYFNRFFGTMTFASSEILQGKQYRAPHAEVWSLGVLLSILLSGECPFADPTAAIRGKISRPTGSWSSDALNLLMACLVVNPDKRATISQIRQHPWVAKAWSQRGQIRPGDIEMHPQSKLA